MACGNLFEPLFLLDSKALKPVKRYERLTGGELKKATPTGIKLGKKKPPFRAAFKKHPLP